jgi:hypothetical protein
MQLPAVGKSSISHYLGGNIGKRLLIGPYRHRCLCIIFIKSNQVHPANRTGARLLLHYLRMHGTGIGLRLCSCSRLVLMRLLFLSATGSQQQAQHYYPKPGS